MIILEIFIFVLEIWPTFTQCWCTFLFFLEQKSGKIIYSAHIKMRKMSIYFFLLLQRLWFVPWAKLRNPGCKPTAKKWWRTWSLPTFPRKGKICCSLSHYAIQSRPNFHHASLLMQGKCWPRWRIGRSKTSINFCLNGKLIRVTRFALIWLWSGQFLHEIWLLSFEIWSFLLEVWAIFTWSLAFF